jgi:hypothetical protein
MIQDTLNNQEQSVLPPYLANSFFHTVEKFHPVYNVNNNMHTYTRVGMHWHARECVCVCVCVGVRAYKQSTDDHKSHNDSNSKSSISRKKFRPTKGQSVCHKRNLHEVPTDNSNTQIIY